MVNSPGATAVAEKPAEAGLRLATLPNRRVDRSRVAAEPAEGVLSGLPGPVTDLALSRDGHLLVAAHLGQHTVSIIDTGALGLLAGVGVAEPHALAVTDRCYVNSATIDQDVIVAVDTTAGVPLAAQEIGATARGLAVSPSGTTLYVARGTDDGADIAVIDVESGHTAYIPVAGTPDAVVDMVRIAADGQRLFAARTSAAGSALLVVDTRTHRVRHAIDVRGSISDIAVHPDGRRVLVTGWDSELGGVLTVIDVVGSRVVDTIAMGGLATQVVLGPTRAYVISDDRIVVVDVAGMRVVDTLAADHPASCIAVSADGATLYIGGYDGTVTAKQVNVGQLRAAS